MATVIPFANGKNGFCQVNSNCRSIHLDFPFLQFRLTVRNSILAHRCRLAYATSGMWEVPFIVIRASHQNYEIGRSIFNFDFSP